MIRHPGNSIILILLPLLCLTGCDKTKREFNAHYEAWKEFATEDRTYSSPEPYTDHPEYEAIVAMGKKALPYIVKKLEDGEFLLNTAMQDITGVDILEGIEKNYNLPEYAFGAQDESKFWISWWQENKSKDEWQP